MHGDVVALHAPQHGGECYVEEGFVVTRAGKDDVGIHQLGVLQRLQQLHGSIRQRYAVLFSGFNALAGDGPQLVLEVHLVPGHPTHFA